MIFPDPKFVHMLDFNEDLVKEKIYESFEEILQFFVNQESTATISLMDLNYLMRAKDDKSLEFALTIGNLESFSLWGINKDVHPMPSDYDIAKHGKRYRSGGDIICYRKEGEEKVFRRIVVYDEAFDEEKNGVVGKLIYERTGMRTEKSDYAKNIIRSTENVKKYDL